MQQNGAHFHVRTKLCLHLVAALSLLWVPVVGLFIASTYDIMQKCSKHIEGITRYPPS